MQLRSGCGSDSGSDAKNYLPYRAGRPLCPDSQSTAESTEGWEPTSGEIEAAQIAAATAVPPDDAFLITCMSRLSPWKHKGGADAAVFVEPTPTHADASLQAVARLGSAHWSAMVSTPSPVIRRRFGIAEAVSEQSLQKCLQQVPVHC